MIRIVLNFYCLLLVIDAVLVFLPQFQHAPWAKKIKKAADFTLNPVRKYLPPDIAFDISPLVVIIVIQLIQIFW